MATEFSTLLERVRAGDTRASADLVELVYAELRRVAARFLKAERRNHTLQTTALVHEAYLRLAAGVPLQIQDRHHFFAVAAQQMRRVLVDYGRASRSQKRGEGAPRIGLNEELIADRRPDVDVMALDEALEKLQAVDARAAKVVELRFFGGYTDQETAEVLGINFAAVRRDWAFAKAWLMRRLDWDHSQGESL